MGMIYRYLLNENRLLPGAKLPFGYPLALFQGTEGWKKGLVWEDLIDTYGLPPELHRWLPKLVIDLIRLDEDSPRIHPADPVAGLGLSLMRAVMFKGVSLAALGLDGGHLTPLRPVVPLSGTASIFSPSACSQSR